MQSINQYIELRYHPDLKIEFDEVCWCNSIQLVEHKKPE